MYKQGLDFIETIDLQTSSQYSKPLPTGIYKGIDLYFSGAYSSSVDPQDCMGLLRLKTKRYGDIFSLELPNLQKLNNAFGGLPDSTSGTDFHALVQIPFQIFGIPNALHINKSDDFMLYIEKVKTTTTTFKCEVGGVYGMEAENYIPVFSQDRYTSLGGLQSEGIGVQNIMGIMMLPTETTEPDLITIETERYSNSFSHPMATYNTDMLFNVESASLGAIIIPFVYGSLSDAISGRGNIKFSGGAGYLDYVVMSAIFDPARQRKSRGISDQERKKRYSEMSSFGVTDRGFSKSALVSGG